MDDKYEQVVKIIWHQAASSQQTGDSVIFARWHQCTLPWGHFATTWQIQLNLCCLGPCRVRVHKLNGKLMGSAVFAQLTAEGPYTLQWDAPFALKFAPSHGRSGSLSNTCFLGPTWVLIPNGILIGSAVFAGLTSVSDRLTDHATWSVTIGRISLRSMGDAA